MTTSRVFLPTKKNSLKGSETKDENKEEIKDYYSIYFIESHLKNEDEEIEILIDSSNKYLKQLKKINKKEFKDNDNNEFIVNVYSMIFKPNLIKKKEIKELNKIKTTNIKIYLKKSKNKFESVNSINIQQDNFLINIKFEMIKGWFGKTLIPPEQIELSNLQMIQMFNEAILIKEKKKITDEIYLQFIEFGINLLKKSDKYELEFFLILYISIINGENYILIKDIFYLFEIERIINKKADTSLLQYQNKLDTLYKNQNDVINKIEIIIQKNIYDKSFEYYLIKFYTIYIYYIYNLGLYQYLEEILKDLRDNNSYNNLILPLLYLSNYNSFYKNIPISNEIKNSLINRFIYASSSHKDLITSFCLISDYINKNIITLLSIITENYDKINGICLKEKKYIKINEYIKTDQNDDLNKIKGFLDIIIMKINKFNFKSIIIDINIWDFYLLKSSENNDFFIYLKSFLVQSCLTYDDLEDTFNFLSKHTNKNFIAILEIIKNNHSKIYNICYKENKQIIINKYITQNNNDNYIILKEYLSFILSKKRENNFESINFHINIFNYYIENKYPSEFLLYLEKIIYENSISFKDINDSFLFSSYLNDKGIIPILQIIINNFDNIIKICKNENKNIILAKYISNNLNDDLLKINEFITIIVDKEKLNLYNCIKFDEKIWIPYLKLEDLDNLKFIKKIINKCKEIDSSIDEDFIDLGQKIHDIGFDLIKKGQLKGEKLILFLGEDEAFYSDKKNKYLEKENNLLKEKNNELNGKVNNLIEENKNLKNKLKEFESNLENLSNKMGKKIKELNKENDNLKSKINKMEDYFSVLEKKIDAIKSINNND